MKDEADMKEASPFLSSHSFRAWALESEAYS